MQVWTATNGNLVWDLGTFTRRTDIDVAEIRIMDGWGFRQQTFSMKAMMESVSTITSVLVSLDDTHVFGPYVVTSHDVRGEPSVGSDGVTRYETEIRGAVWPHIDWLVLDSAAEGFYYAQVESGVRAIGLLEPFRSWISGLVGQNLSAQEAAQAFTLRVMNDLIDSGSLNEMNTSLHRWNLLLRPTVSTDLRPRLRVLPRYPLNVDRYRSDEQYPPLRFPVIQPGVQSMPGTRNWLSYGTANTTRMILENHRANSVVFSTQDRANAVGTYRNRAIQSTLLNFTDPAQNASTDVTVRIAPAQNSLIPPIYLPQLQDGELFDIVEGRMRQDLEWSARTVYVEVDGNEYMAPRNQFAFGLEIFAISSINHVFDADIGFYKEITGSLIQDAQKLLTSV